MKKSFFLSILAVGALVACSKSEVVETSFDNAIKFDNYVGRDAQTKAAVVSGVTSVNVNAWLHEKGAAATGFEANFMENQAVTKSGETWTYTPAKFWPNELQAVSFVGWVENVNATVNDANLDFVVPADAKAQTDLLVSNPVLNQNGGTVNLNFKHLLSRIGFEITGSSIPTDATDAPAENVVKLVSVVLNGTFANYGNVNMTVGTDEAPVAITAADVPTNAAEGATKTTTNYTLTGTHFGLSDGRILNATYKTADEDSYLMIIPDQNAPTNITVTYKIITGGNEASAIENVKVFSLQPTGEGAETFAYKAGKAYLYKFYIELDQITFSVEETDWVDETPVDINPEDKPEETPGA